MHRHSVGLPVPRHVGEEERVALLPSELDPCRRKLCLAALEILIQIHEEGRDSLAAQFDVGSLRRNVRIEIIVMKPELLADGIVHGLRGLEDWLRQPCSDRDSSPQDREDDIHVGQSKLDRAVASHGID